MDTNSLYSIDQFQVKVVNWTKEDLDLAKLRGLSKRHGFLFLDANHDAFFIEKAEYLGEIKYLVLSNYKGYGLGRAEQTLEQAIATLFFLETTTQGST